MLEGFVPWPTRDVKRFKDAGYWKNLTFSEHLDKWVKQYADLPALAIDGREITYRQMDELATCLAFRMTQMGIKTYDRVILQMANNAELVYMIYACMKIGAIPVCTLVSHRWAEISYLSKKAEAVAHLLPAGKIKDFDYEEFAEKIREATPSMKYIITDGKPRASDMVSIQSLLSQDIDICQARQELTKYRPDPMNPAIFQLSGGTTGVPKIISRTHNDYEYGARCIAEAIDYNIGTRLLLTSPLAHNAALINGLLPLHSKGGTLVLSPSLAPEALMGAIAENKVDTAFLFSVQIHRIMSLSQEVRNKYDMSSFKRVMGLWAPTDSTIFKFLNEYSCQGIQSYGMTEGLVCWGRWSDPEEIRHYTNGKPVSEADELKIVDPVTEEELPVGEIGHMLCRGPCTIRGYYKAEERNKDAFTPDGYYRTGDLVHRDNKGILTWRGRIKDCIDRGGEKINAEEIEYHLMEFPNIKYAAVIGMPDKEMGERICAFVVPRTEKIINLGDLYDFLLNTRGIAKFKIPERVEFLDELPVTKVGKFEKKSLKKMIIQKLEAEGKL